MPCGCGGKQPTVMEKAKQTMSYVQCKLDKLKEDLQLQRPQPNLCPRDPPQIITCPNPCKPRRLKCNVRASKCANLRPSWLCGNDLDKYIANQEFEGPYTPETKILKRHLESKITCSSGGGICNCSLENPCSICLMETIKNLIDLLTDGEGCCPPPCKPPCCSAKPCPCRPDIIDPNLIQLCPSTPFSAANKCWLVQRGQCMINFAKQKYVAPFCTCPEELLPSQCGQGWIYEKKCEPAKRKPEFQFDPYNPYILHAKKCGAPKTATRKPNKKK